MTTEKYLTLSKETNLNLLNNSKMFLVIAVPLIMFATSTFARFSPAHWHQPLRIAVIIVILLQWFTLFWHKTMSRVELHSYPLPQRTAWVHYHSFYLFLYFGLTCCHFCVTTLIGASWLAIQTGWVYLGWLFLWVACAEVVLLILAPRWVVKILVDSHKNWRRYRNLMLPLYLLSLTYPIAAIIGRGARFQKVESILIGHLFITSVTITICLIGVYGIWYGGTRFYLAWAHYRRWQETAAIAQQEAVNP